jgi:ferredoxin
MTAPAVFVDDEQGHGQVIAEGGLVVPGDEDVARQGADNCPERAITLD